MNKTVKFFKVGKSIIDTNFVEETIRNKKKKKKKKKKINKFFFRLV